MKIKKHIKRWMKKHKNLLHTIVYIFIISCIPNIPTLLSSDTLTKEQNEIDRIIHSPILEVKPVIDTGTDRQRTPEIFIYNHNQEYPGTEYSAQGQYILIFHTKDESYSYLLPEILWISRFSSELNNTERIIEICKKPDLEFSIYDYIEKCSTYPEITSIEEKCYCKVTYKDMFQEKHERYYDLSNGSHELDKGYGAKIFHDNQMLPTLFYDENTQVFPLPPFLKNL